MKRSTFLKTLGLTAAAAFCNCRIFAVPQFALPGPSRWDAKLPPELDREDLLQYILDGALQFARDGIRPSKIDRSMKVAHCIYERGPDGGMQITKMAAPVMCMALESEHIELGSGMTPHQIRNFIASVQWVLEDVVRDTTSIPLKYGKEFYEDAFPVKFNHLGFRVSPFTVHPILGYLESNPVWHELPETHGIPRVLIPRIEMSMEAKSVVAYDDEQNPRAWYIRAFFARNESSKELSPV